MKTSATTTQPSWSWDGLCFQTGSAYNVIFDHNNAFRQSLAIHHCQQLEKKSQLRHRRNCLLFSNRNIFWFDYNENETWLHHEMRYNTKVLFCILFSLSLCFSLQLHTESWWFGCGSSKRYLLTTYWTHPNAHHLSFERNRKFLCFCEQIIIIN